MIRFCTFVSKKFEKQVVITYEDRAEGDATNIHYMRRNYGDAIQANV